MLQIYSSRDIWQKEKQILEAVKNGKEIKLRIDTLFEMGVAINDKYPLATTDFFKAASIIIISCLDQFIDLAIKPVVLKIQLKPKSMISVYIPMSDEKYIKIFQKKHVIKHDFGGNLIEEKISLLLKDKKEISINISSLIQLFETRETIKTLY